MPESSPPPAEPCPACAAPLDVRGLEPWSPITCPSCRQPIRARRLFPPFTLLRPLGLGGMSRVFEARDSSLGRDLALKILHPNLRRDDRRLRQFEREAHITASISHPNVVKVYTAGRDQDQFYIAMELVDGGSLDDKIRAQGRLPEAWVLDLAEQVALGLKAASDVGLIHRDIKPGNILLSAQGTPKIVDFGLAVFTRDGVDDSEIWATPFYVPPETLHGEPEDFRSDIYALGATLYHALMGKPPFNCENSSLSELKVLKSKPADLKEAFGSLSQETAAVLARSLKRNPSDRYASYDEFLDHLRYARRRLRRGGRGAPWPNRRRHPAAQWAAILAAAALAATGLAKLAANRRPPPSSATLLAEPNAPANPNTSTVSAKFLAARETLCSLDFPNARSQFAALAADPATPQPTRNWAHYNAALAALLAADLPAARQNFAALRSPFPADPPDQEVATFFAKSAATLDRDDPVPPSHASDCPPDSTQAIGLLAAGLKNWHLGDFPSAASFLRAFASSTPPRSAAWVDRYKQLAQPYLDDIKVIDALPPLPLSESSPDEARAQLLRARSLAASLTLPGAAQAAAATRLADLEAALRQSETTLSTQAAAALQAQVAAEFQALAQAETEVAPLGRKLAFDEATAHLRQIKPSTPLAQAAHADLLRWWEDAASFLDSLAHDLATPIDGMVERSPGPFLRGQLSSAPDGLKVKPPSGPESSLPLAACSPASLAALAERLLDRLPDSDQYYRRRELLVAFALQSGLKNYAQLVGRALALEYPPFRARWARLAPGL